MHHYRILEVYITVALLIIVNGFWVHLLFRFKRKRLFQLIAITILLVLPLVLYVIQTKKILKSSAACVNKPIILKSNIRKKNPVLLLKSDFCYEVYFQGEVIRKGSWDAYSTGCTTIILDEVDRIGFREFRMENDLDPETRTALIREHLYGALKSSAK